MAGYCPLFLLTPRQNVTIKECPRASAPDRGLVIMLGLNLCKRPVDMRQVTGRAPQLRKF